jgi:predicted hydrolase (HD superfamily)
MARALLACDELTGFVTACSRVHPEGIGGLTAASVVKKFRQKSFAAKVDREEMLAGAQAFGLPVEELAEVVIGVLRDHREELGL